jgi:hypothetical protein
MTHEPQTRQRGALAAVLCAIALLVAGAAPAVETAARITAVAGGTNVGAAAADRSTPLAEDSSVQTAGDGNCAMLVDEDALVELCSSTIMTLTRKPDTGNRVVQIDAGTTRVVAEPRVAEEYIEIHTPAAIATIMGTTVFVEVDPVTGGTKITSDHPVKVTSSDPNVAGSAVSSNMEQVTILPGQAPSQPQQISQTALANLGGCLVDFHALALSADRNAVSERTQDRMALGDGELLTLSVALEPPAGPDIPDAGSDEPIGEPDDVLEDEDAAQSLSEEVVKPPDDYNPPDDYEPPDEFQLPGLCDGLPCDGGWPPY